MEKTLDVRPLTPADGETILALCRGNPLFYAYNPPEPTLEGILEDMRALPPGRRPEDKHFLGFWQGETLVAVMDLELTRAIPRAGPSGRKTASGRCKGNPPIFP